MPCSKPGSVVFVFECATKPDRSNRVPKVLHHLLQMLPLYL